MNGLLGKKQKSKKENNWSFGYIWIRNFECEFYFTIINVFVRVCKAIDSLTE